VDSVYTDFSMAFDRVRHLEEMSMVIEPGVRSYLTRRIQKIRIGDAASKDTRVTSGVPQVCHLGPLFSFGLSTEYR
jgi:hypothetical protein